MSILHKDINYLQNNASTKYFDTLIKYDAFLFLDHKKMVDIIHNLLAVTYILTEQDFVIGKIKEDKKEIKNKIYINNYTYVLNTITNEEFVNKLILEEKKYYEILVKKNIREIANEKTLSIIEMQDIKKNIKLKINYSGELCRFCDSNTIKISTRTGSIDEGDIVVRTCHSCYRQY